MSKVKTAATKRFKGHTISDVKEIIETEFDYFIKSNGHQSGVLNLIGPAGIGKTESVYQIAEEYKNKGLEKCQVVELYLSALMDPESAAGTPIPVDHTYNGTDVKALSLASRVELLDAMNGLRNKKGELDLSKGAPILFIDEMGREADQLRPLIMKLLHEKKLGGLDVSACYLVVAGNPSDEEHNTVAIQEDAAISSRLTDIFVKADVQELRNYFYRDDFTHSHKEIADFLVDNPQYMYGRDSDGDQSTKFHSPRSWFNTAYKLHLHGKGTDKTAGNIKGKNVATVIAGTIGSQGYNTLKNFMSKDRVVSLNDILKGNFGSGRMYSVPPSAQMALKTHLGNTDMTPKEADNLADFLNKIPADLARTVMREAGSGNMTQVNTRLLVARKVFQKFISKITKTKKKVN